jgi:hypothetical protein
MTSSISSRGPSSQSQRHICARCGKPRSSRYHESHPLVPGQIPQSDICTRPECARFRRALVEGHCPQAQIIEVHHYYHRSSDAKPPTHAPELPGQNPLAGRAEAIGDSQRDAFQQTFRSGRPSLLNPPAYATHTAELPGQSPLAGRAEAIGDSQRYAFQQTFRSGRPSPMNPSAYPTHVGSLAGRAEAVGDSQHKPFQQTFRAGQPSLMNPSAYPTHVGSLAGRAEAVGDLQRKPFQQTFASGRPSLMNPSTYPTHVAGLQEEASLAGRGQLQYSAIQPKYRSGRLSPIREESPPSVNYLTKPTLHWR